MNGLNWDWRTFGELSPATLYAILELRSRIFVVEQNCVFPDMDGLDQDCEHLCGFQKMNSEFGNAGPEAQEKLIAYLRLIPPGIKSIGPALGRVVVEKTVRGTGLGRAIMSEGLRRCAERYPGKSVKVSAQQHLETFYNNLGFARFGAPYLEDNIWHIDMATA